MKLNKPLPPSKPQQLQELYSWLDRHAPQPIDTRMEADLSAGRLDSDITRALEGSLLWFWIEDHETCQTLIA